MIGQLINRTLGVLIFVVVIMAAMAALVLKMNEAPRDALRWVSELRIPLEIQLSALHENVAPQAAATKAIIAEFSTPEDSAEGNSPSSGLGSETASSLRTIWENQDQAIWALKQLSLNAGSFPGKLGELSANLDKRYQAVSRAYEAFDSLGRQLIDAAKFGDNETVQALLPELDIEMGAVISAIEAYHSRLTSITSDLPQLDEENKTAAAWVIGISALFCLLAGLMMLGRPVKYGNQAYRFLRQQMHFIAEAGPDAYRASSAPRHGDPLVDDFHHLISDLQIRDRLNETFGRHLNHAMIEAAAAHGGLDALKPRYIPVVALGITTEGLEKFMDVLPADEQAAIIGQIDDWLVMASKEGMALRQNRLAQGAVLVLGEPFLLKKEIPQRLEKLLVTLDKTFPTIVVPTPDAPGGRVTLRYGVGISAGQAIMGVLGGESGQRIRYDGAVIKEALRLSEDACNRRQTLCSSASADPILQQIALTHPVAQA